MQLQGWGRYPIVNADVEHPAGTQAAREALQRHPDLIAYGLGRSYGDSALNAHVLQSQGLDHFLAFDEKGGILEA